MIKLIVLALLLCSAHAETVACEGIWAAWGRRRGRVWDALSEASVVQCSACCSCLATP